MPYVFMVALLAGAFALLILFNYLLEHLWGELIYGVVITGVALWALAQTWPVRWLLVRWRVRGFSMSRALLWSSFVLVALPVAFDRRWGGLVILLAPLAVWTLFRAIRALTYAKSDQDTARRAWPAAVLGMGVLAILVATRPAPFENDEPAGALPVEAAEVRLNAQLARLVRPLLLFDRAEVRFPLDVADAVRSHRVSSCSHDSCTEVRRLKDLDRGANFLEIADYTGERGGGPGSTYYYHVVDKDRPNRIYVDYWWYFTRNPSPIGATVGCGPGARWVGVTCHDHPSDWEGVTVVLGRCRDDAEVCVRRGRERWTPIAVRYAQHEHVVSFAWEPTLRRLWRGYRNRPPARPLVYVARDSHASYAAPCLSRCKQFADYPLIGEKRDEAPHGGQLEWNYNRMCSRRQDGAPAPECLQPVPITDEGLAASWNAFPGRWGRQRCILAGSYCDTGRSPSSPSRQSRYRDPGTPGPWMCVKEIRATAPPPKLRTCGDNVDPDERIPS